MLLSAERLIRREGPPFAMLLDLPDTLEFDGEFGAEINSFIPFVYWLHLAGQMRGRRVVTFDGMRPFYYFLSADQLEMRTRDRLFVPIEKRPRWLPTPNDHASTQTAFEVFPDYRTRYRNTLFETDKPLLVVHNKFTLEWHCRPVNFLQLPTIERIFAGLADRFTIIYTRAGIRGRRNDYSEDEQNQYHLDDLSLLRRHPHVLLFEDIVAQAEGRYSYNELKLMLYASAYFHITAQGGNAHMASLFSGSLIGILHRYGREIIHSYANGHFQYASNPRPDYLICRSSDELMLALDVFAESRIVNGRVQLPAEYVDTLTALAPDQQCGHDRMIPMAWS